MLKILIPADLYGEKVQLNEAYVKFMANFGEPILVLSSNNMQRMIAEGDVLCLPGGADVDPMRYNEYPQTQTRINPHYEYMDKFLLGPWLETGKPIIGICRGLQTLNVAMGGSLFQHIRGHAQYQDRAETPQTLYTDIPGYQIYKVNSFHHQAIKRLARGFDVIGWAPVFRKCGSLFEKEEPMIFHNWVLDDKKKIVKDANNKGELHMYYSFPEIIKHRDLPYIAFQYHPEEFNCPLAHRLICETLNLEYVSATRKPQAKIEK